MKRYTTFTRKYKDQADCKNFGKQFDSMFDSMGEMFSNMSSMFNTISESSITEEDNKTIIKKGDKTIVIDKDGNVTINGKKVEEKKEEEKKPKFDYLEKLPDIPKIDDPNLFKNTIPTKVCVHENLTTPLTLAHLDKYELELTNLESKLGGRIKMLFIAVAMVGMMSLTTLISLCLSL